MYKEGIRKNLRFASKVGSLNMVQLWSTSLEVLDDLAISLQKKLNSTNESFLTPSSKEDKTTKLMFDIVFDVMATRLAEMEQATASERNKEHNQEILALIKEKEREERKKLSIEDLKKELK